uniref:Nuclear RNA export factor 1 n=1 Tax=Erpetoichthys calabaricus TaxID=27687 RepID=A0A8C4SED0_ERPCA
MAFRRRRFQNFQVVRQVHFEEQHDDRVGGPTFRTKKGRGPFRGKMYSEQTSRQRYRGGGAPGPRSRYEDDDDGDVSMSESLHDSGQRRYMPYGTRPGRRGEERHDNDRDRAGTSNNLSGLRLSPREGSSRKGWFKVTIPFGKKYSNSWLLSTLQGLCMAPFEPVQLHYEGQKAVFYVEDSNIANALKASSKKIRDKENFKLIILVRSSSPPSSVVRQELLKPEAVEILKQCMSKRYDRTQQALDLSNLRSDPDLLSQNIDAVLNRKNIMQAVVKIIEEYIPELLSLNISNNRLYKLSNLTDLVGKAPNLKILNLSQNELKSDRELDRIKGFKLEELWLDGNPLCDFSKDQTAYIRVVRERFPKLLRLDGHDLPLPITFDVEAPTTLPPCKGSYFGSDEIKSLVLRFLHQYFYVYDSGDRQALLDAYHDGASFSVCIPISLPNPSRNALGEYHKDSRNLKKVKDPTNRFRMLKHTRLNVVAFLNELPKTQHDVNSFVVDVHAYTNMLLSFTVNGVFKEVDDKSPHSVRAFTRAFIAVPSGNSGLCIVNDELFVRKASSEEIRKAFATPAPTPSSSPVPTLTARQQEMLTEFSQRSGMNLEWSQKCLLDNDWDYTQAGQVFEKLNAEGKIPEVAFKQYKLQ